MFQIDRVIQVLQALQAKGCKGVFVKTQLGAATINLEERTLGTGETCVLITPHEAVRTSPLYQKASPPMFLSKQRERVYHALDDTAFLNTRQLAIRADFFYADGSPDTATIGNVCRFLFQKGFAERTRLPNPQGCNAIKWGYRRKV